MFHHGEVMRTAKKPNLCEDKCTYGCNLCDSGDWLSETEVELHKKSVHSRFIAERAMKKAHACFTCAKTYKNHKALIEHIKFNHLLSSRTARRVEREIFICHHCQQIFFNKDYLEFHIVHRHFSKWSTIVFKCPLCHKKKNSKSIYNHLTQHEIQSVSVCQICLRKQKNRKALAQHLQTHLRHYNCTICGFVASKKEHFDLHLDVYERKKNRFEVKNYKECFVQPYTKNSWKYSPIRVGLRGLILYNEVYICVLCRQICISHSEMQEHILRDHSMETGATDTAVTKFCACGEKFSNTILLKHHIFKNKGLHKELSSDIHQSAGDSSEEELIINTDIPNSPARNTDSDIEVMTAEGQPTDRGIEEPIAENQPTDILSKLKENMCKNKDQTKDLSKKNATEIDDSKKSNQEIASNTDQTTNVNQTVGNNKVNEPIIDLLDVNSDEEVSTTNDSQKDTTKNIEKISKCDEDELRQTIEEMINNKNRKNN